MSISVWSSLNLDILLRRSGSLICVPLWLDENTSARRFTSLRWAWRVMAQ